MFIGREGETAAADPSSREQQQQYAFNKNKYSSRWLEYTIWLCVYRGMKPATIIIIIIIIIVRIIISRQRRTPFFYGCSSTILSSSSFSSQELYLSSFSLATHRSFISKWSCSGRIDLR